MPQSGLVPEGASFSKFNGLYKIIVQCLEQLKCLNQEFLPYSESGFSFQFPSSTFHASRQNLLLCLPADMLQILISIRDIILVRFF